MAKLRTEQLIVGYFVSGVIDKASVAAALDAFHLHPVGDNKPIVEPMYHPDFDPATKTIRQKETKLLAAPTNGHRQEKGKTKDDILKKLLELMGEVPYPQWKRDVAKGLQITPAGVENHCKFFRKEGLFDLKKGMLVPHEGKLNRVRNRMNGETTNA
jgi:hypothetical protein